MADRRKKSGKRPKPAGSLPRTGIEVSVRKAKGEDAWELVHPRCAVERQDDLEEVAQMLEEGEIDVATDELRWLLSDCSDFIDAHKLLGMLALSDQSDLTLARGHFGFAYQCGIKALRKAGNPAPLPHRLPANQSFFEAGKGLAHCLGALGKPTMAREVIDQLLRLDSTDPLGLAAMRTTLHGQLDVLTEEEDEPCA